MDRLIVKNFGPLKDIDIELNKINLFIGENGSGKSVLAKLITIISDIGDVYRSLYDGILGINNFKKDLEKYGIQFLTNDSYIHFYNESENTSFYVKNNILISNNDLVDNILNTDEEKIKQIFNTFDDPLEIIQKLGLDENMESMLTKFTLLSSKYIPAERNLISLFNKSITTLLVAEVPLPKFLLQFSSEFEKASNELKELEFLGIKYINSDGLDRHKVYFNDEEYLSLEHSSSGIQSALPLYLTVKYFAQKYRGIIIEEPEQNLFPKAQSETIRYIIEQVSDRNNLFMMTHSPYVLSVLNILIFAHKVAQVSEDAKRKVEEFIKEEHWINPHDFSAYYLENGIAKDIKSSRGLISDNEIDDISEDIAGEFDELMEIYREFKDAK